MLLQTREICPPSSYTMQPLNNPPKLGCYMQLHYRVRYDLNYQDRSLKQQGTRGKETEAKGVQENRDDESSQKMTALPKRNNHSDHSGCVKKSASDGKLILK